MRRESLIRFRVLFPIFCLGMEFGILRLVQHHLLHWSVGWTYGITDWDLVGPAGATLLATHLLQDCGIMVWTSRPSLLTRRLGFFALSILMVFIAHSFFPWLLTGTVLLELASACLLYLALFRFHWKWNARTTLFIAGMALMTLSPWLGKNAFDSIWSWYIPHWAGPILSKLSMNEPTWSYNQECFLLQFPGFLLCVHAGSGGFDILLLGVSYWLCYVASSEGPWKGSIRRFACLIPIAIVLMSVKIATFLALASLVQRFFGVRRLDTLLAIFGKPTGWTLSFVILYAVAERLRKWDGAISPSPILTSAPTTEH